jgi:hypothetical protein
MFGHFELADLLFDFNLLQLLLFILLLVNVIVKLVISCLLIGLVHENHLV